MSRYIGLCLLAVAVGATQYKDCGSVGKVTSVEVTDCVDLPCVVRYPNTYAITIDFEPASASKTLLNQVIAIIGDAVIPVSKTDACGYLVGAGCPLLPHTPLVFNSSGTMQSFFPQHMDNVHVQILLVDDNKDKQACVEIVVDVRPPLQ